FVLPFSRRLRLFAGWQWFTANRRCANVLLETDNVHSPLARYYRNVHCPDESYFQCVLCNHSGLRIGNDNKRYVDWSQGGSHPKTLDCDDLPGVFASGAHFARKFNPDCPALDELDEALQLDRVSA